MLRAALSVLSVLLAGCQTQAVTPDYVLQMEAYRLTITSQSNVEIAKARAEEARYNAIAAIGERSDGQAKQMAILALALGRSNGADVRALSVQLPQVPESQEDKALKWASIFAGPVIGIAQGYFGYRLGVTQSNNAASASIASYDSMSRVGIAGFDSISTVAQTGFRTNAEIAGFGLNLNQRTVDNLQRPNVIVTNGGVIGSGSYVGPNSGANSGNTGRIGSPDCPSSAGSGGLGGNELLPGTGGASTINCPSGRP